MQAHAPLVIGRKVQKVSTVRGDATQVEFYPALVVHGPLLATLLLGLVQRERPHVAISSFSFRAMRPAFDNTALRVNGRPTASGADLWTSDAEGFTGMRATATFACGRPQTHDSQENFP